VNAGTTIFLKDDPGNGLFALSEGVVKFRCRRKTGREAVLNLVYAGEIFGESRCSTGARAPPTRPR